MASRTIKEYHGKGYIYDNGDVPECSFCGTTAEDSIIHSGDYSGEHICESEECMSEYMNQNVYINSFDVVEKRVTVCDDCDEVMSDYEEFHKTDGGQDICDYCYEKHGHYEQDES